MLRLLKQIVDRGVRTEPLPLVEPTWRATPQHVHDTVLRLLGRALAIRHVDAGSCNGCELEIQALGNPYYNVEGHGIKFVASPRHADLLLVTGPVTSNMREALRLAFEAMPEPRLVVAAGLCACNGGIFGAGYACCGGVSNVLPVDVVVPGCPPPPIEILRGILTAVSVRASSVTRPA